MGELKGVMIFLQLITSRYLVTIVKCLCLKLRGHKKWQYRHGDRVRINIIGNKLLVRFVEIKNTISRALRGSAVMALWDPLKKSWSLWNHSTMCDSEHLSKTDGEIHGK